MRKLRPKTSNNPIQTSGRVRLQLPIASEAKATMPRFSCKHRSSKSPEDLTSNDGTFACLCRHCHLTADKHRSRKLHRALMVQLGELNTIIDLVQNNRLDPATITLELHRLHAQRKEAKDQYRLDLVALWKEYEKRWRIRYIPHEYWI